jgi:hypothetical protein
MSLHSAESGNRRSLATPALAANAATLEVRMPTFNRRAASDYALAYALHYNPGFYDFKNLGTGGDCTNFVSQALLFGGWPMVFNPLVNWPWYAQPRPTLNQTIKDAVNSCSGSWRGAKQLAQFLYFSGRAEECSRKNLEVGDIVSLTADNFGKSVVHHMMVTKIEGTGIFLSYHSREMRNNPLDEVLKSVGSGQTYGSVIYWKVLDHFKPREIGGVDHLKGLDPKYRR